MRPLLFLAIAGASVVPAACTQGSQTGWFTPQLSAGVAARATSKLGVKPKALDLFAVATGGARNAVVFERGYNGEFVQKTHCKGIAKASPATGKGPRFTFRIVPKNAGSCSIVFLDDEKRETKLDVTVSAGPGLPGGSPSPIPSTEPSGLPSPAPGTSPAAIFVTYTGSGTPNVVGYDEQGNVRPAGPWSGSGLSPESIVYAQSLNRFYLIASNVNSSSAQNFVEVYSGNGQHVSGAFSPPPVTNAGAVAFGSTGALRVYVTDRIRHTITAFGRDGALQSGVTFPSGIDAALGGLAFDSNLSRLYVANAASGKIEAYTATGTPFPLGGGFPQPVTCLGSCVPSGVTFDLDNNQLYTIWSGLGGGIAVYSEDGTPIAFSTSQFAGLTSPRQIAIDTHDRFLYVTDGAGVRVFDESGNAQPVGAGAFTPSFGVSAANGIAVKPP